MTKDQIEKIILTLLREASQHTKDANEEYPQIYTSRMAAAFTLVSIASALEEAVK